MIRAARYEQAQRELAYRTWVACEANMAETLRRLDSEHDWPLAKQTLQDWRETYGWVSRRAAEEAEAKRRKRAQQTDRSAMLASIDLQIGRYDEGFAAAAAEGETPDPRAVSAYANLLRLRLDLVRDLDAGAGLDRADLVADAFEWLAGWVRDHSPEHAEAVAHVLTDAAGPLAEHLAAAGGR